MEVHRHGGWVLSWQAYCARYGVRRGVCVAKRIATGPSGVLLSRFITATHAAHSFHRFGCDVVFVLFRSLRRGARAPKHGENIRNLWFVSRVALRRVVDGENLNSALARWDVLGSTEVDGET